MSETLKTVLRDCLARLGTIATRNTEDFDLDAAPPERLEKLILSACVGCCRIEQNSDFASALGREAATLKELAGTSNSADADALRKIAERLTKRARKQKRKSRGRPRGGFSSRAGAKLQAVVDAHVAQGKHHELRELLAAENPWGVSTGKLSQGAARLSAMLEADEPGASHQEIQKAIRNTRAKVCGKRK